jgi:hypothetical protein
MIAASRRFIGIEEAKLEPKDKNNAIRRLEQHATLQSSI